MGRKQKTADKEDTQLREEKLKKDRTKQKKQDE
jgi:hypothetical protein